MNSNAFHVATSSLFLTLPCYDSAKLSGEVDLEHFLTLFSDGSGGHGACRRFRERLFVVDGGDAAFADRYGAGLYVAVEPEKETEKHHGLVAVTSGVTVCPDVELFLTMLIAPVVESVQVVIVPVVEHDAAGATV